MLHSGTLKFSHPTIIQIFLIIIILHMHLQAKEAYNELFKTGHSAATVCHSYETRIMLENDDEIMQIFSDRAVNLNLQYVSCLFAEWKSHILDQKMEMKCLKNLIF